MRASLLLLFCLITTLPAYAEELSKDEALIRAKIMASELGAGLKDELTKAMAEGGPTQAIGVCKKVGQKKAIAISRQHGAYVHRVSLRLRNQYNYPDDYEFSVLNQMEVDHKEGKLKPAYVKVVESDGRKSLRFMKPLLTGSVCLQCHGDDAAVSAETRAILDVEYPDDDARGYGVDQVRGAISVIYPMNGPAPEAPEATLESFDDSKEVALSSFRGKKVILNFWATWCVPCKEEMPDLDATYQTHKKEGLVVIGVNYQESRKRVSNFLGKTPLSFPILLDKKGEVAKAFGVKGLPTTIFIDTKGRMVGSLMGVMKRGDMEGWFSRLNASGP